MSASADGDVLGELEDAARGLLRQLAGGDKLQELKRRLAQIERRGGADRVDAEVISAIDLSPAERAEFERRLRARHGAELPIAFRVDPAILGGVVVRVGDRMVDGSVAARLGQLHQVLVGARAAGKTGA